MRGTVVRVTYTPGMIRRAVAGTLLAVSMLASHADAQFRRLETGPWRAWLDVEGQDAAGKPIQGGQLPFTLELARWERGVKAWIVNGEERIEVPRATWGEGELTLWIDYYDSVIRCRASEDGRTLEGEWTKRRGADKHGTMRFGATSGAQPLFAIPPEKPAPGAAAAPMFDLPTRWRVAFEGDEDPAVGIFETKPEGVVHGTFLTTTGDYRYLAGEYRDNTLRLACFDGSHAFLFAARQTSPGRLEGEFYSGNWSRTTWTAIADEHAALPDSAWTAAAVNPAKSLRDSTVKTLDGLTLTLDDPRVLGENGTIFEVFGTWCPNCLDASRMLVAMHDSLAAKGVKIVGLAFELTGDERRDRDQVRLYATRHKAPYLILLAGVSDKAKAAAALPVIERIKAYPTFLFVDRAGKVRATYTGFSGPATGDEHARMRAEFERRIDELLTE